MISSRSTRPLGRDPAGLDHLVHRGVFEPGHEPHRLGGQLPEPRIVGVPSIHHHDGARLEAQGAGHPHVMPLPLGDNHHAWQVAIVVQQAVQLDRPFRTPELRPVEQGRAQVNDRRVQTDEFVLEAKLPPTLGQRLAPEQQRLEHGPVELPGPMFVRVGQRRATRRRDPQVLELALAAAQPAADLPQRVGPAELAEQHRDELPPAREPTGVALGMRPRHQRLELGPRKELEQLAEHAAESAHG
jgi:hypothetical protein